MKNIYLRHYTILLISLLLIGTANGAANKDIRILIDVSGSMKRNDPHNLRVPALRLLTELLPDGTRAGIWTFGRYVNMLVPLGQVDETWRKMALQAADKISAHGLDTNIEGSFKEATWDWKHPDDKTQRSIILLTDGYVDIAGDSGQSAASRGRILNKLLPGFQQAGVTINTIALSSNADEKLLQQLASSTNGFYQRAATAEKLERVFFHMFEKATRPDTLPLQDNTILVDDAVREMTLLVFRHDHAPATRLTTPAGRTIDYRHLPPGLRWHQEDHYDLITIKHPAPGTWRLVAERDPDNRAMIVTHLQAITTQLPNNISLGEHFTFLVSLTDNGRVITKKEFLHFIKVTVKQESPADRHRDWLLLDNGRGDDEKAGDGIYTLSLNRSLVLGKHDLQIDIDGTTFKRSQHQRFHVYDSPLATTIEADGDKADGTYLLDILPRAGMIDPDSIRLTATITADGETLETQNVPRAHHNEWQLKLNGYPPDQRYQLHLDLQGRKPDGKPINRRLTPLDFGAPADREETTSDNDATAETTEEMEDTAPETTETEATTQDKAPPGVNWWLVILEVLLWNLLVIGALIYGYKKWALLTPQLPPEWQKNPP